MCVPYERIVMYVNFHSLWCIISSFESSLYKIVLSLNYFDKQLFKKPFDYDTIKGTTTTSAPYPTQQALTGAVYMA